MFPLSSYQCHRCLGQCALSAGHVDMTDFFMVHIPLMNYKNMHNPSILVQENECLFGQEYKLTAVIQIPGAVYRTANLNQHYMYLNQDHAGVHVLLYAKMNNGIPSCGSSQRPPSYTDVLQSYKNTTPPHAQTNITPLTETNTPPIAEPSDAPLMQMSGASLGCASPTPLTQTPHHSQKQTLHPLQN